MKMSFAGDGTRARRVWAYGNASGGDQQPESAGDLDGAVALYTHDVVHDLVGAPTVRCPDRTRCGLYEYLAANVSAVDRRAPVDRHRTQRAARRPRHGTTDAWCVACSS